LIAGWFLDVNRQKRKDWQFMLKIYLWYWFFFFSCSFGKIIFDWFYSFFIIKEKRIFSLLTLSYMYIIINEFNWLRDVVLLCYVNWRSVVVFSKAIFKNFSFLVVFSSLPSVFSSWLIRKMSRSFFFYLCKQALILRFYLHELEDIFLHSVVVVI
jgi:hypothetical protein